MPLLPDPLRRAATILLAAGGGAGLGMLATLLVARTYGPDAFGLFATLTSAFALLGPLAALGTDRLLLRHTVRDEPAAVRTLLGPGLAIVLLLSTAAAVALALVGPWLFAAPWLPYTLGALGLFAIALQPVAGAAFQADHRDTAVAVWSLALPVGRLLAAAAAALLTLSFTGFLGFYALLMLLIAALGLGILHRWRGRVRAVEARSPPALRPLLHSGAPFAASGLLYSIYYQVDVLMLGALVDRAAAGHYKAAMVFIAAAYLLPAAFIQRYLLPRIFRWRESGGAARRVRLAIVGALAFGLAAGGVLAAAAGPLVALVYGSGYEAAVPLLRLLALAVPFHCVAIAAGGFLVAESDIRAKVRVQGGLAVLNVGLNALLIPLWGGVGAAVATVATEIALAAAYLALGRRAAA